MPNQNLGVLGTNPDAFGVWLPDAPGNVPWQGFLDGAAAAGYATVELGPFGYLPTDPGQLADALAIRSLGLTCGYVSAPFHDLDGLAAALDAVRRVAVTTQEAGAPYLMLLASAPRDSHGRLPLDSTQWRNMVRGLAQAQKVAAEEFGLTVVYHPHVGLAVETQAETERLIADTGGELGICLDVGQFAFAGGDPADFIDSHGGVVEYLHLRDLDTAVRDDCVARGVDFESAARAGVFCEPGAGSIDFSAVVAAAERARFHGPVIVERSLLGCSEVQANEAAARASAYFRSVGFG